MHVQTNTSSPGSPSASGGGRADRDPVADAAHLDQHLARSSRAVEQRCPAASRSSCPPRALRPRAAAGRTGRGRGGRGRGRRRRRRRPGGAARAGRAGSAPCCCTCSLPAAPSPATACFTSLGVYCDDLAAGRRRLGHGQAAGLAHRHGGAHVDLEEHPLDGDHVGAQLGDQRPELALQLGQPVGQRARPAACGARRWRRPLAARAPCRRRSRSRTATGPGRSRGRTRVRSSQCVAARGSVPDRSCRSDRACEPSNVRNESAVPRSGGVAGADGRDDLLGGPEGEARRRPGGRSG